MKYRAEQFRESQRDKTATDDQANPTGVDEQEKEQCACCNDEEECTNMEHLSFNLVTEGDKVFMHIGRPGSLIRADNV